MICVLSPNQAPHPSQQPPPSSGFRPSCSISQRYVRFPLLFLLSSISIILTCIIFISRIHDPTPNTARAFSVSYYTNSAAPSSSSEIYRAAYDKCTGCSEMVPLSSLPCHLDTHTSPLVGNPIQERGLRHAPLGF